MSKKRNGKLSNQYKMLTEAEFNMHLMFAMFIGAKQIFNTLASINLNSLAQ